MAANFEDGYDYDYLLERAKSRLLSAQAAYEKALREKEKAEAAVALGSNHYKEMNQLEAELRRLIFLDENTIAKCDGQLHMVKTRRAISKFLQVKAFIAAPAFIAACLGLSNSDGIL
jgi:hypothetical protein